MDLNELHDLLGRAYHTHQVRGEPMSAIADVRLAVADPLAREAATAHRDRLSQVISARSQGGQVGCHVSKVTHDILSEALREPA